jgi:hypothetical protein
MSADAAGNDLAAVGVPIGGLVAFAEYDAAAVIADTEFGKTPLELPTGLYEKLGLVKVDGAPQHSRDTDDAIEFWQQGYGLAGPGTRSFQVTAAENSTVVDKLTEGKEPDENGVIYVDSALPDARLIFLVATKFRNGVEERYNGVGQVTAIDFDQDTRGEVRGKAITVEWKEDDLFNGSPFKTVRVAPASTPAPAPAG